MTAPLTYPFCVLFILVTELCERFAFYGFTGSLVCFFKTRGFHSDAASEFTSLFGSIVYLTPVLGAYVADVHLGRFQTIAWFCALYIIGLALTTAGAWPTIGPNAIPEDLALTLAMVGLFGCVTVGAGGIKSNVVVLGADQFQLPEQAKEQESFFNFFYWCINIGATGAFLFLANVAVYGLGDLIPQRFGFFASFAIPLAAFLGALVAFVAGRPFYSTRPPEGSAVTTLISTLASASWRTCTLGYSDTVGGGLLLLLACLALPSAFSLLVASFFLPDGLLHDSFAYAGLALILIGLLSLIMCGRDGGVWVFTPGVVTLDTPDTAIADAESSEADAAAVVRLLPVAACVVVFWTVYSQMSSNFQLQGFQMDLHTMGTMLSPATLNVFDSVAIMLLIPAVDRGLYPCIHRITGVRLSMLTKMSIGFAFATASVIVAGFVERMRRSSPILPPEPLSGNTSLCGGGDGGAPLPMSTLSIWWQTPQYILIGLSEIFAAITCYELFYSTVPPHMRSVCQSINLLCTAFGSLAAAGLNSACAAWIPDNLNDGHLDYLFFLLAGLMAADLLLFTVVGRRFAEHAQLDEGAATAVRRSSLSLAGSVAPGMRLSTAGGSAGTRTTMMSGARSTGARPSGGSESASSTLDQQLLPGEQRSSRV